MKISVSFSKEEDLPSGRKEESQVSSLRLSALFALKASHWGTSELPELL